MLTDQILVYQTTEGKTTIDVKLIDNTVWLNQYYIDCLISTQSSNPKKLPLIVFMGS